MKKNNKKGFTLAELLIVVAIIAVLVAIAIPVFSTALSDAQAAVKNANIRAARAEATVDYIVNNPNSESAIKYSFVVTSSGDISITNAGSPAQGDAESFCSDKNTDGGYTGYVVITGNDITNSNS